jgi:hypothetical protein
LSRRPSRPMQKILPKRVVATLMRVNGAARQFSTPRRPLRPHPLGKHQVGIG